MRFKQIMILAMILVTLLAVSTVSAAENVTSDVVGVDDNDDVMENVNNNVNTASDSFINKTTFGGLVFKIDSSTDGNVSLDRDYTFIGAEYYIDPVSGTKTLVVDSNGITVNRSLTINGNGHTINAANGASFFIVNAPNLVLKDINFVNGINNGYNSPIVWKEDNGVIENCTFSNVTSAYDGGVINWVGDKGNVTNCNFTDCYAMNAGAIIWNGDEGTVSNSNFNNCTPHDNAGSIKWIGSNGTVTGSSFANCHVVKGQGAAIIWEGANGTVDNSNFANLTAESVGLNTGGGAIYWSGINGIISNSNFANASINWQGGAINWHNVNGTITDCNFFNCTAGGDGGAIYIHSANCSVFNSNFTECNNAAIDLNNVNCTVKNSNFFNCSTVNSGGAIRVYSDNCTVSNSNFANCNSSTYGSAVKWYGGYGILTECTFDNCYADNHGAVDWSGNNGIISNSNFTNCYSTSGSGGAIGKSGAFHAFTILNSNFINCSSNGHGGAIYWGDGNGNDYTMNNSYFFNCSAVYQGGAIWGNVKTYNSNFDKCVAETGGAMYKGSATNCTFTDNKAKWGGAKHSSGEPTINCTFIGNTASDYAGAVYGNSITNCTFTNNTANNTGGSIQGAQNVLNCKFTNSYANGSGGAINGAKSVVNCNFNDCHAKGGDGGAVRFYDYGEFVDNCNFTDCSANASGGAVFKSGNGGAMYNSNFMKCSANADGGAIYSNARSTVVNCTFTNNLAARDGGAVRGGNAVNCSFNGNSATACGGALYASTAKNCTFWDNTASEGNNWYDTNVPMLKLNVANFNSIYGSGETILLNATENNVAVNDVIITIRVSKNGVSVANYSCLTNEEWLVDLDAGSYEVVMTVEHNAYRFDNANNNKKVITLTIDQRPTNITASDVSTVYSSEDYLIITLSDFQGYNLTGKTISVVLNGVENYTTDDNGKIKVPTKDVPAGNYTAVITFDGTNDNYNTSSASANVTVAKATTSIAAKSLSVVYDNGKKYLVATLTDGNGNPVDGVSVSTNINALKAAKTDKNGQVKWLVTSLTPKTYSVVLKFAGNSNYINSTKKVTVKVTKASTKISAKAKTFKRSDKTKKYSVTLNVKQKVKVTIKVNKKTYTAYTTTKGVATFKLNKLTNKGKYTATVNFGGNAYYNKAKSVNVKITVN